MKGSARHEASDSASNPDMLTTLYVGVSVPPWDRKLMAAIWNAMGHSCEAQGPVSEFIVLNEKDEDYRRVVATSPAERFVLLDCFSRQHFVLVGKGLRVVARRSLGPSTRSKWTEPSAPSPDPPASDAHRAPEN